MADSRFDETDAREVIRDLRTYELLLKGLMDESTDRTYSTQERNALQERYTSLKIDLKERHRQFNLGSVSRDLNSTEGAFLSPALCHAFVQLSAPVNSHPSKWYSSLESAHYEIVTLLRPLEEMYPE